MKNSTTRYITPPIGNHKIVYRGRRFLVIKLIGDEPFEYATKNFCDYVFYDKLLNAIVAFMSDMEHGAIEVSVHALNTSTKLYENMDLAIKETPNHVVWAMRDYMGK